MKCYKCGKDFNEHIEERIVGNKSVLVSFLCPTKVCETFTFGLNEEEEEKNKKVMKRERK